MEKGMKVSERARGRRAYTHQVPVVPRCDQRFEGSPDVLGDLLRDLVSPLGIHLEALQVSDHDADDVVSGERLVRVAGEVVAKAQARRGNLYWHVRPHLAKGGKGAALHVRLLHQDERARVQPPLREQITREPYVLAGVGRAVFDQDPIIRHPESNRDAREEIGFGLLPHAAGDRAAPAREDQQRRATFQVQLRTALRHDGVVAAQDENGVTRGDRVVQLVVVPDHLGEPEFVGIERDSVVGTAHLL